MFAHDDNCNLYHHLLINIEMINKTNEKEDKTEDDIKYTKKLKEEIDKIAHQLMNDLKNQIDGKDLGITEQIIEIKDRRFDRRFEDVPGMIHDRVIHYRKKDLENCRHVLVRKKDGTWTCVNCFNNFFAIHNNFSSKFEVSNFAPCIAPTKQMECAYLNLPIYYGNEISFVDDLSNISDYSFKYLKATHELGFECSSSEVAEKISSYIDEETEKKNELEFQIIKYKLGL